MAAYALPSAETEPTSESPPPLVTLKKRPKAFRPPEQPDRDEAKDQSGRVNDNDHANRYAGFVPGRLTEARAAQRFQRCPRSRAA